VPTLALLAARHRINEDERSIRMADVHAMAMQTRNELFDELQELTDDDLAVMTCCDPWTVKHLVAHMTALGNQSVPNFMLGMLRARGNFDRFVASDLQKYMKSTEEMKAGFKATLARAKPSPGPKYVMLGEYTVHGEDIRRVLGRRGEHPAERLQPLAEMYAATKAPIDGKRRAEGLSFRATDGNWSIGEGREVAGPGIDLVRAISGRVDAYDTLEGPGLETLKSR
jgi:uncharacterized protein (TIGR03083 family)